jgi:hypothetical protein
MWSKIAENPNIIRESSLRTGINGQLDPKRFKLWISEVEFLYNLSCSN